MLLPILSRFSYTQLYICLDNLSFSFLHKILLSTGPHCICASSISQFSRTSCKNIQNMVDPPVGRRGRFYSLGCIPYSHIRPRFFATLLLIVVPQFITSPNNVKLHAHLASLRKCSYNTKITHATARRVNAVVSATCRHLIQGSQPTEFNIPWYRVYTNYPVENVEHFANNNKQRLRLPSCPIRCGRREQLQTRSRCTYLSMFALFVAFVGFVRKTKVSDSSGRRANITCCGILRIALMSDRGEHRVQKGAAWAGSETDISHLQE